jgi:nitroreductase
MDLGTVDKLLTTTRSIRRRLDLTRPVPAAVIQECLEIAVQAPTGGDAARYHFVVVTNAAKRARLADLYRRGLEEIYPPHRVEQVQKTKPALMSSVIYLADHFHEVPVHIVPCITGREAFGALGPDAGPASFYGSILPATWSLMLALRHVGEAHVMAGPLPNYPVERAGARAARPGRSPVRWTSALRTFV